MVHALLPHLDSCETSPIEMRINVCMSQFAIHIVLDVFVVPRAHC
jgi:hypothetical protein